MASSVIEPQKHVECRIVRLHRNEQPIFTARKSDSKTFLLKYKFSSAMCCCDGYVNKLSQKVMWSHTLNFEKSKKIIF